MEKYLIFAPKKDIKLILDILEKHGVTVYETKQDEYLFVMENPVKFIPEEIRRRIKIEPFTGKFLGFIKNAGRLKEILNPKPLAEGTPVKITGGRYEGFFGIIRKYYEKEKTYEVEINVWGMMLKEKIERDHVVKTEAEL